MTRNEFNDAYFEWMYSIVCRKRYTRTRSYRELLQYLHSREFTYLIPMDGNRAADGVELRYRFGYENSYGQHIIALYLDDRPCSVLEMLLALAIRCEEHIMGDDDIGDRTAKWFWDMIINLGLNRMDDNRFNINRADEIIDIFLNREYDRDGTGGLFTVKCGRDMRSVEIWYQMCWYLDDIL